MSMAYNITDPKEWENPSTTLIGLIYDEIFRNEIFLPKVVEKDGVTLPGSNFHYQSYPCFGSVYDMFTQGGKISIGTNPSSTPVLTYYTSGDNTTRPQTSHYNYDNRKVYLNGLSIEVMEQRTNGDIKIRIRWDDFDVNSNMRWCGPVVYWVQSNPVYLYTWRTTTH